MENDTLLSLFGDKWIQQLKAEITSVLSADDGNLFTELLDKALHIRQTTRTFAPPLSCTKHGVPDREVVSVEAQGAPPPLLATCSGDEDETSVGDCLPPLALAWKLGCEHPVPVSNLVVGDMVLTSKDEDMCYAPVAKISSKGDGHAKSWVKIAMMDGSEAVMTADHPVWSTFRESTDGSTRKVPIRADQVLAELDSLSVMKLQPMQVKYVAHLPLEQAPLSCVRIQLGDPGRREDDDAPPAKSDGRRNIFVAAPMQKDIRAGFDEDFCWPGFVAVGDSRAKPASTRLEAMLKADGLQICGTTTGLSVVERTSGNNTMKRSSSDSNLLMKARVETDGASIISITTATESSECSKSEVEEASNGTEILIGGDDNVSYWTHIGSGSWRRSENKNPPPITISGMRALPRKEDGTQLSYGSIGHVLYGQPCKVCVFNRKPGAECRNGVFCNFCHADHKPFVRSSRFSNRGPKKIP